MRFGVFYELQLPKPWDEGSEHRLFHEALEQVVFADRLGIDSAWAVEHHFLEEYSHCSAPEVFLAAAAAREEKKARDLAPWIEAALARKPRMRELADAEIPVVKASVAAPIVNRTSA